MPATRFALKQDTVLYRNAKGKYRQAVVLADRRAPSAPLVTITAATGGTVTDGLHTYRVSFTYPGGMESAASVAGSVTNAGGGLSINTIDVTNVIPTASTGWKVYGRTSGSELLMGTISLPTKTFVDNGSVTPAGALPSANDGVVTLDMRMSQLPNLTGIARTTTYKATNVYFNR